jgi:hypothetical protein
MADAELTLEEAIDRLRAVPLDEFVAERTRLAKALRAAGERPAAAELAGLSKPTAPAWALNLVAREAPEVVEPWLGTAAALRDASLHARKVGGDAVRAAMAAHRAATNALVDDVHARARPGGRPLSAAMVERVRDLLQAATADEALAAALRAGRVAEDDGDGGAGPRRAAAGEGTTAAAAAAPGRRGTAGAAAVPGDAEAAGGATATPDGKRAPTAARRAKTAPPARAAKPAARGSASDGGRGVDADAKPLTARRRRAAERAAEKAAAQAARRDELEQLAAAGIERLDALREEAETAAEAAAAAEERRDVADARLAGADEARAAAAAALADAEAALEDARRDAERSASESDAAHEAARAAEEAVGIAERELRQVRGLLRKA